jgi:hypothetical protein
MKINLPGFVIADLYKDCLVIGNVAIENKKTLPKVVPVEKEETGSKEQKYWLGENKKNILFLVHATNALYITDEHLATLTKILEALKMNLADVAILNYYPHPKTFQELKETLQPKYILLFDVSLKQLQLPFIVPHYQIQRYDNCTFMTAPALILSSANTETVKKEKKLLWENLKKIFKV